MGNKYPISNDAAVLVKSIFQMSNEITLSYGGPGATMQPSLRTRAALVELEAHGYIIKHVNQAGRITWQKTPKCDMLRVSRAFVAEYGSGMLLMEKIR